MRIDLGAEMLFAAEKGSRKIAVEVKSFIEDSSISVFHEAVGQYDNYSIALEDEDPDRTLFLAVPADTFNDFFQEPFIQKVLNRKGIKLIVYQPESENVEQWIL